MEGKKKWKVVGKNGESVYDIIKEALRDAWALRNKGAQGFHVIIYVADVDPDTWTVTLSTAVETPSTTYHWTRDYRSPCTVVARYDPYRVWDIDGVYYDHDRGTYVDNGEPVSEEELIEYYSDIFAREDEEAVREEAIRTAEEIIRYEAAE